MAINQQKGQGILGIALLSAAFCLGSAHVGLGGTLPYCGVNLGSAAFAPQALPGVHGTNYIYPAPEFGYNNADYYLAKGMNTFRVPFLWERLQPKGAGTALDADELGRLQVTVDGLLAKGAYVILDPHNYARYRGKIIGDSLPKADFADFWNRLAQVYANNAKVFFGLMNEPHGLATETWLADANAAIEAIRATGAGNLVLVPGNFYTGAHSWSASYYGTPNAQVMLEINDPAHNFAFEVHQYLDADSSGTNGACVSSTIGSERLQEFTAWARQHGYRAFLGEFGSGSTETCTQALDDMVNYMEENDDVYLGWTYWAAGPWWPESYFMKIEPTTEGGDRAQMEVLEPHLTFGAESSAQVQTTPPANKTTVVYNAESMFHSNGAAYGEGWMLWANGHFATNHSFTAAPGSLTVRASGTPAQGVYPHMTVSIDDQEQADVMVTGTMQEYTFDFTGYGGIHTIRISFDNDVVIGTEDRNLIVDTITIGNTSAVSPAVAPVEEAIYHAEDMNPPNGNQTNDGWKLWCNGTLATHHEFSADSGTITVKAKGSSVKGIYPHMQLLIGDALTGESYVTNAYADYSFSYEGELGNKVIAVRFDNDATHGQEDRNLTVDTVTVKTP